MVKIRIGDSERTLKDAEESWINQQINDRRLSGDPVCVRIFVQDASMNMVLSTCDCADRSFATRPPNLQEKRIFDLWDRLGLNKSDFHAGSVIAFLKQIER